REYLCVEASRVWSRHLWPTVGDALVTTQRRPIVTMIEDTTPGIHDTIMAACDRHRYVVLGVEGYHRNCQDNMFEGLLELGVTPPFPIPGSWNIFMNIPIKEDGYSIDMVPTVSEPGQYIVLQAEIDCYMVFSACPQDILPIHGQGGAAPVDCHFQIVD
ncbi:MAG: urea carboxylase-associated family protein, partial [bacterium]|nr:urea carboxylase-associated family protein [bacterium]